MAGLALLVAPVMLIILFALEDHPLMMWAFWACLLLMMALLVLGMIYDPIDPWGTSSLKYNY